MRFVLSTLLLLTLLCGGVGCRNTPADKAKDGTPAANDGAAVTPEGQEKPKPVFVHPSKVTAE